MDSLHVIKGMCKYTENFIPDGDITIPTSDPYSANTVLMMHMDGTNGSKTFIDSSYASNAISLNGDVKLSTSQSKFGSSSAFFNGVDGYLTIPSNPSKNFEFGLDDFTIECYIYHSVTPYNNILITDNNNASGIGFAIQYYGDKIAFGWSSTTTWTDVIHNAVLPNNTWHHIAGVRRAGYIYLYLNGIAVTGSGTKAHNYFISVPDRIYIGKRWDHGTAPLFNGYIDEVRITKGVARYTDNFVLPTSAFS